MSSAPFSQGRAYSPNKACGFLVAALRHKPYSGVLPAENANLTKTDQRRVLYTLARDYFRGARQIIDGGAYFGGSWLSFGYGLKDRGYQKEPITNAFDRFIIDEFSVQSYFHQDGPSVMVEAG